jgi:integrase
MATISYPLTRPRLDAEPLPAEGRKTVWDATVAGLCCRITKGGDRSFYLSKKVNGAQRWVRIGSHPETTVKDARDKALALLAAIVRGERPWEERKTLKEEAILSHLWEHYRDHASGKKKPSSRIADESLWRSVLEPWGGKKRIGSIARSDVQKLVNSKGKATPTRANRTAALLSSMFNRAIAADLWKGANPAKGVERFREVSRDRFLRPDELRVMFASLAYEDEGWKIYFMAALLCGARRSNLLAMRWADLDLARGLWRVDAEESKNGQAMQVILPEDLQKGLTAWKTNCPSPVWVFPSDESASGHKSEPCKPWERVLARAECFRLVQVLAVAEGWPDAQRDSELEAVIAEAGRLRLLAMGRRVKATGEPLLLALEGIRKRVTAAGLDPLGGNMLDVRMHDLRRTLGSWATMTGASLSIVGKVLGHRSHQSTAIYARLDLDPARLAVEKAASAMLSAGEMP